MFSKTIIRFLFFPFTLFRTFFLIGWCFFLSGIISVVWHFFLIFVLLLLGLNTDDSETIAIFCTALVFVVASLVFIIGDRNNIFTWLD